MRVCHKPASSHRMRSFFRRALIKISISFHTLVKASVYQRIVLMLYVLAVHFALKPNICSQLQIPIEKRKEHCPFDLLIRYEHFVRVSIVRANHAVAIRKTKIRSSESIRNGKKCTSQKICKTDTYMKYKSPAHTFIHSFDHPSLRLHGIKTACCFVTFHAPLAACRDLSGELRRVEGHGVDEHLGFPRSRGRLSVGCRSVRTD